MAAVDSKDLTADAKSHSPSSSIGTGASSVGYDDVGNDDDYIKSLQAWLEQHKNYPRAQRLRRQQGKGVLYFKVDRLGRVLAYELVESTGNASLDKEVEAMLSRAQPLPAMPDAIAQSTLEIYVPVEFTLR